MANYRRYTPTLEKHKSRYNARFYNPETKQRVTKSLGTSDKRIAIRRLMELTRAYDSGEFDPFAKTQYEFGALLLPAAVERYMKDKAHNRPATLSGMKRLLKLLQDDIPAGCAVEHITESDVLRVIDRCKSDSGRLTYFIKLRAFFSHLESIGYIKVNPMRTMQKPRKPDKSLVYVRPNEFATLLKHQETPDMYRRTRFAVASGLRLGEICSLTWARIDREVGRIYIGEFDGFKPKAGSHVIPLLPYANDVLREIEEEHFAQFGTYPPSNLQVFVPEHTSTVSHRFKRAVRAAGLDEQYHFNSLRHTFASWAVIAGIDVYRVSKWLGHASIVTTEIYAHLAPEYGVRVAIPKEVKAVFGGILAERGEMGDAPLRLVK